MQRLTETQLGMFLEWNADRTSLQYNISALCRLPKDVDLDRLEAAVRATVDAHAIFRGCCAETPDGVAWDDGAAVEIPYSRRTFADAAALDAFADAFPKPIDLLAGPLARFVFAETPTEKAVVFEIAHLVIDGSSGTLFFDEVDARYSGRPIAPEGADYAAFAAAEEASFASSAYAEAAADAKARFGGRETTLPDDETGGNAKGEGVRLFAARAFVPRADVAACCSALGVTPNLFLMGVFARTLGLFANTRDVVFTTVNHGRRDKAFRATLGPCIKTVPVLAELKGELALKDYLASLKLHRAGVYPFTHAARELGIKAGFMFVFQEGSTTNAMKVGGVTYPYRMLSLDGASDLPAAQIFPGTENGAEGYDCRFSCLPGRYSREFLAAFAARFATVARNFAAHPDARLGAIPVLDARELSDAVALAYGGDLATDPGETFPDLFARRVAERPAATAVVDCETSLTYGELDAASTALAGRLAKRLAAKRLVSEPSFVGLMLPRRVGFVVAAIAVQKCGAGYVPIDPEYPADRIAFMLEDAEAPVLVTTHALFDGKGLAFSGEVIFIDEEANEKGETEKPSVLPSSPAYMIYTSGSTGKPKGVVVPQRALRHLCAWVPKAFGYTREDRVATHASFSFDASVIDIFPTLAEGAALHLYSEEVRKDLPAMRDYIVKNAIAGGTMSTQIGMALVDTYPDLPLSYLLIGGEKLLPTAETKIRLLNGYGPTEFCVASSYHVVDQKAGGEIPIGRAVPGTWSFVCDPLGQPVPRGMRGEICLAGPQIADGYWHRHEKTAEAFVEAGFAWAGENGATRTPSDSRESGNSSFPRSSSSAGGSGAPRLYRTGDYARYNAQGLLDYLGRIDFQVKLRGFRIEIGEIEHAAAACAGVAKAIALVREVAGAQHLMLYYEGDAEAAAVKAKMSETLTGYMVPDFFVRLAKMPLTPVGKIDRRALPLPAVDDEPAEPPANEREAQVLAIAREVLKSEAIGVTHDLNRAGLTSLGAMKFLARLKAECGLALTMRKLVATPTVRAIVAADGGLAAAGRNGQPAPSTGPDTAPQGAQGAATQGAAGGASWGAAGGASQSVAGASQSVAGASQSAAGMTQGAAGAPAAGRRPKRATYPMTENQRGIYADWLRAPEAVQYNIPAALRFPNLDAAQLAAAVEKAIAAHPALKARFVEKDGEIVQQRRDELAVAVPVETLEAEPDAAFFAARTKPFAPDAERLVRATVFAAPSAAYLFFDAHHTVFDGLSLGVLLGDILRALDGATPAGEAATAFDAALDERDYLESELLAEDDVWFAQYLDGCSSTRVETSSSGADGRPGEGRRVVRRTPAAAIVRRCRELGASASDWFLATFMELLKRTGRTDDVQIAFVSAGRSDPALAEAVGMFVKTVPVRNAKAARTVAELVRRTRDDVRDLIDRDRYSYARACERLGLSPEVIFAFEGGLFDLPRGATLVPPAQGAAKCPLSVIVTPGADDFELAFEYDAALYSARDMEMLLGMFETLAQKAAETEDLRAIPLVADDAAARLVALSYGGDIDCDDDKTFIDAFRAVVRTRSFATAVADGETSLTYGELDAASTALAGQLAKRLAAKRLVSEPSFVGLMLPRRVGFVVAAIAVQKCGAGYVPIDPEYPADRIAFMLEDAEAPVLVTTHALFDAKGLAYAGEVIFIDEEANEKGETEKPGVLPSSPAYMIYTSGSTGKPKGVVVPQRALHHLCAWVPQTMGETYASRVATHPSFSFDASVIDIFPVLAVGGELHIFPEELRKDLPGMRDFILSRGITHATMSTQIGMALIDAYPDMPLQAVMLGGEKLMPTAETKIRIFNGYGPTEFCVCSSAQEVDQTASGDIPIGRAVPGTWSFVVDRYGHLLPQGYAGEIALAGPQLADGYWHRPDKTASAFVAPGFSWTDDSGASCGAAIDESTNRRIEKSSRFYRTGDLARYNGAGLLEYCGRIDFQVKLRGFRIEIGEIEQTAASFPGVGAVAAEVRAVGGAQHLVLYYAAKADVDEAALRAKMAETLTAYMVPDYFVKVDAMPMTPNGKINRKALVSPDAAASAAAEYVAPRAGAESEIAGAYAEVLKLERFGATQDFFLAGGTSLIAIKAVVALQKRGLDVQYGDLFKHKTPRALAAFLTGAPAEASAAAASDAAPKFAYGDYDYAAIDAMLAKTRTDLFDGFKVHSLGDVLLTGATGYLGIHVLRHLLERTSSSVVALVRPKGRVTPERRLDAQYVYYFGERLPARFRDRLSFVAGDVTDADLGAKLADVTAHTVLNCAALVKHYVADDAMDRVNVGGVENLIAWCAKTGARLVQTSTYSVGGTVGRASPAVLSERTLYVGQDSDNDYIRTKFTAERAVLAAVAAGKVRGKVMRLGNLMGRESDGEFQMNVGANAFVNSLKSYKAIGAFPLEELAGRIEMSPIDRVAEAVCLLATTPDDMAVFHPFNTYALDMGAVLGALARRGYAVEWVSRAAFAAHVDALRNDPARASELQGILHYARRHLEDTKMTPVANDWTTTVLYRLGFRWKPAEDRYLANFLEMLDGLAVFD